MRPLVIIRRLSQLLSLSLVIYILWSTAYPPKGLLSPRNLFVIDPFITFTISISERVLIPGALASLFIIAITLLVGRFFCGWLCPLGTMLDMAAALRRRKYRENENLNRPLRRIKFYLLGAILLGAIFGIQAAWPLDPIVIVVRFISLNLIPAVVFLLDSFFVALIKDFRLHGALQDLYRALKSSTLGIEAGHFAHAGVIFSFFIIVCGGSLFVRRFWCRALCPLGALYAILARFAPLARVVDRCKLCGKCRSDCRMGAIKEDLTYVRSECVLCMDCIYDLPEHATRFEWKFLKGERKRPARQGTTGISRREFLFLLFSSLFLTGWRLKKTRGGPAQKFLIRPPAAPEEEEFLNRCIRCGNCMRACVTNGLQPAFLQADIEGMWTPHLVPEIGYCEYNCTLCGEVCPTGAIPRISTEKKHITRLGTARIDRSLCLPWAEKKECAVCQEHCPIPKKAIRLEEERGVYRPYVDERSCVGCGLCQNKCPVRPARAIKVSSISNDRSRLLIQ